MSPAVANGILPSNTLYCSQKEKVPAWTLQFLCSFPSTTPSPVCHNCRSIIKCLSSTNQSHLWIDVLRPSVLWVLCTSSGAEEQTRSLAQLLHLAFIRFCWVNNVLQQSTYCRVMARLGRFLLSSSLKMSLKKWHIILILIYNCKN